MTCTLKKCGCIAFGFPSIYCQNWQEPEKPLDDLDRWSIKNWNTIPEYQRKKCLDHLYNLMKDSHSLKKWKDQAKRDMKIGSDDVMFHFHTGMFIRNTLRDVLLDSELPPIRVFDRSIQSIGNWDDYYYGALDALVRLPE